MREYVVAVAVVFSVVASVANCGGASSAGPGAAGPSAADGGADVVTSSVCATFYADGDLQGTSLVAHGPSDGNPKLADSFNDVMSSVAVTPGCTVMAYADADYGGQEVTFTQTTKAVPPAFNDQMSSFKCTCH